MNTGRTVFARLMEPFSRHECDKCVDRYRGHHRVHGFSGLDQFLCMAFAQLTGRERLRDIEACLTPPREKLYHIGFRGAVPRSTLADANERRDFLILQDFAHGLIAIARKLYQEDRFALELEHTAYALDSTAVDLCLSLFPWAHFRKTRAAVKMHTLLDLRGSIRTFICVTTGKFHHVNLLDAAPLESDSIVTMDRAYVDYQRLSAIHRIAAFFVVRGKRNLRYRRIASRPVDKSSEVRAAQTIALIVKNSKQVDPETLRRVSYFDAKTNKRFVFLTNHFEIPAKTVADIYRQRWLVELFFRWIEQHLCIKTFYGASPNAVKTQIRIAISIYLVVAISKKQLDLPASLHTILQILEINVFEKRPIFQIVSDALKQETDGHSSKPLNLFES